MNGKYGKYIVCENTKHILLTTLRLAGVNIREAPCLGAEILSGTGDRDKLKPIYEQYNLT